MTEPMTAEEARVLIRVHEVRGFQAMLREIDERSALELLAALRAYAVQADRIKVLEDASRRLLNAMDDLDEISLGDEASALRAALKGEG